VLALRRSTFGMDELLSGETHRTTAANAAFLQVYLAHWLIEKATQAPYTPLILGCIAQYQASVSNYRAAGVPVFQELLTLAEEHIERQFMESKLQRAVAHGDFIQANDLMTQIGEVPHSPPLSPCHQRRSGSRSSNSLNWVSLRITWI
jgi:hypothetical protein